MMARKRAVRTHAGKVTATVQRRWRLDDAFAEFLRAKRLQQLKPRTLQDHETHFRYFSEWLTQAQPKVMFVDELTVHVLRDYIEYMLMEREKWGRSEGGVTRKGLSPVTVNIRLRTLKCLLRWWEDEGICKESLADAIQLLRTEEDTLRGFTNDEVVRLFAQPDQTTYAGFRDFSLQLLLLDTGARIGETLALTVDAIDFDQGLVHLSARTTKTRKGRALPLSRKTVEALRELVDENRENFGSSERHLFLSASGMALERYVVTSRLHMYGERAGITGCRVSPHTFRHTFARMYLRNGGDAFSLQRLLGHSSMDMVRRYVQLEQGDLQDSHARYSPLSNFLSD